ncbi:hypothetical protein TNCV_154071 [Trichonephila clavipes]|nr:hypothetical protein TNCV_154071 [Trichonephila clavipes]
MIEEERRIEERRMNERIALEEEMRLKERWLVEEQMRHVQEKHRMRIKEQNCLYIPEERCKRMNEQNKLLSEEQEKLSDEDMEVLQDTRGREKLAWRLLDFVKRIGVVKVRPLLPGRDNRKTTKVKGRKRVRLKLSKRKVEFLSETSKVRV